MALLCRVNTGIRILSVLNTGHDTNAALVVSGILEPSSPDAPRASSGAWTSGKVLSGELEVVVGIDGPSGELGVSGWCGIAGEILHHAHAYRG